MLKMGVGTSREWHFEGTFREHLHVFGLLLKLTPSAYSPAPQIRTHEDFSMCDVAPHRVPTRVQEENIRHILERAEAFDILIAPLRLDTSALLQRGDYLLSSPGSMKILVHQGLVRARVSVHQDHQCLTAIIWMHLVCLLLALCPTNCTANQVS